MKRIVVGISGASGAIYGVRALQLLRETDCEAHLVITKAARATIAEETEYRPRDVVAMADHSYSDGDLGAALSSGSFRTAGMIVAPCSVKTLSGIATCYDDTLLVRAADVTMKERRPLVLLVRETPLHAGHLRLMQQATESGAVIMPPVPAFYTHPASLDDMVTQTVARALDCLGIDTTELARWSGGRRSDDGQIRALRPDS